MVVFNLTRISRFEIKSATAFKVKDVARALGLKSARAFSMVVVASAAALHRNVNKTLVDAVESDRAVAFRNRVPFFVEIGKILIFFDRLSCFSEDIVVFV